MKNKKNNYDNKPKIEYTYIFKVKKTDELLSFLLEKLNTSRNNVKSLLSNHQVLVNGSVVSQYNLLLAKEDEVKISKKPIIENNKRAHEPKKRAPKIDILYEDDDFFAINKPAGLLSVESDKDNESAFSYVLAYMQSINKQLRPFVIHRIDKETSGVLVFAKSPVIQSKLRLNWNDFVIKREYYAVVKGKMPKKNDTTICNLLEDENNMVFVSNRDGQNSITHYEVLKEKDGLSLLRVLIDTGRKNQIRVVLNHLGNPICGDDKYDERGSFKRLMLHASNLSFKHPFNDKIIKIESKVPGTFLSLFQNK